MREPDHLIRLANRLTILAAGSRLADAALHAAVGLQGYAPPYTTVVVAARTLLPPGFTAEIGFHLVRSIFVQATNGDLREGQHGRTEALATCGVAARLWALIGMGRVLLG